MTVEAKKNFTATRVMSLGSSFPPMTEFGAELLNGKPLPARHLEAKDRVRGHVASSRRRRLSK